MKYADIIIDNKTDSTDRPYTYACGELDVTAGSKVYVPFARSKSLREGYCLSVFDPDAPEHEADESGARNGQEKDDSLGARIKTLPRARIRSIDHVDDAVSLPEECVRTAVWMRERYVCRCIDALRCFTPAGKRRNRQRGQNGDDVSLPALILPEEEQEQEEFALTEEQTAALEEICGAIQEGTHARFLLHGITGSGKTEVYIRAARETIRHGKKVIVLVPEISLTLQIIRRFAAVFGEEQIAVMHSKLTLKQRDEQWQRIREGSVNIVIGARSAVFAPFTDLGLIVIDEEHEATYKSDFTPKYDTTEVALKRLADRDNQGVLLLGSATPSVATYTRAQDGIYRLLSMRRRYNEVELPEVTIADMRSEMKDGNRSIISRQLLAQMDGQLSAGRQIMLLQNRRGYSTFVSCRECGHVAVCPSCGLSLTYHRSSGMMSCHFCGHQEAVPSVCPECNSRYIRYFGSGTEKVEETVQELFPDAVTDRIDLDSVSRKGELNRRLRAFGKGETDILIGTQMIAKGLDFRNVGLVGIISADLALNIPDYRSPERAFQLITQAAGRAGRGNQKGSVVIQTYNPQHYAIRFAAKQDYEGFFQEEREFRQLMQYPPYGDLIQVLFTGKDVESVKQGAESWYERLRKTLPGAEQGNVLMPQQAYMEKIREIYRFSLVIRCPKGRRKEYARHLRALKEQDSQQRVSYLAIVDINPYSFA